MYLTDGNTTHMDSNGPTSEYCMHSGEARSLSTAIPLSTTACTPQ